MKNPKLLFLLTVIAALFFGSCSVEYGSSKITYTKAVPVYKQVGDLNSLDFNAPAKEVEDAGKIFVSENYVLLGEEEQGIHVIDNRDPQNPQSLSFIEIPGCYEFYVDGDALYANSYFDLLHLDISNINDVKLVNRNESALIDQMSDKIALKQGNDVFVGFSFDQVTEDLPDNTEINEYLNAGNNTLYYSLSNEIIPPPMIESSFAGNSAGVDGTTNRLAFKNDQLYTLTSQGIKQFDRSLNQSNFYEINNNGLETLIAKDNHLYVGSQRSMIGYTIAENGDLNKDGQFDHNVSCDPVLPYSSDLSYVTIREGGNCPGSDNLLYAVLTDNQSYRSAHTVDMIEPMGMTLIDDDVLVVAEGGAGFTYLDITAPTRPIKIGRYEDVEALDVLSHPVNPSILLVANGTFLDQLQYDATTREFAPISRIKF